MASTTTEMSMIQNSGLYIIEVFKKQLSGILGERIPGHCGKVSNNYMQMQKGVFN